MFQYHVTCALQKKVVQLDNKQDIEACIRQRFQIDDNCNVIIQRYDSDWDDYIDVEPECFGSLPDRGKLLVMLDRSAQLLERQFCVPPAMDQMCVRENLNRGRLSSSDDSSMDLLNHPVLKSDDSCPAYSGNGCSDIPVYTTLPLPLDYNVSDTCLPPTLRLELENKTVLSHRQRSQLLGAIYEDVTCRFNHFYCDTADYQLLARSILRSYPHLQEGLPYEDAMYMWHRRIVDKFKNARRRQDSQHPVVTKRRACTNTPFITNNDKKKVKVTNIWGVQNFFPEKNEEDDDACIIAFKDYLQKQSRLSENKRDVVGISLRLSKTFSDRRWKIVQGITVAELKEDYPLLFSEKEIHFEFHRLTSKNLKDSFCQGMAFYYNKLCHLPTRSKGKYYEMNDRLCGAVQQATAECRIESEKKEMLKILGLLAVAVYLNEDIGTLVKLYPEQPSSCPCIIMKDSCPVRCLEFTIFVDYVEVCSTSSFMGAFQLLLAVFHIFNVAYPAQATATLTFFQKIILGMPSNTKKNPKVIKLLAELSKVGQKESPTQNYIKATAASCEAVLPVGHK